MKAQPPLNNLDTKRLKAMLILGPTGSGKTPIGNLIEKKGLNGQRCHHFDFGENLRLMSKAKKPDKRFTPEEIRLINSMLTSGSLLEKEHFYLARKILDWFVARKRVSSEKLIVLNGLPRHIGQAKEIDSILDIKTVIHLACAPKTIRARIKNNSGGDRLGRTDDNSVSVQNKIAIFNKRTAKLIEHYRSAGKEIIAIEVKENTTAADMLKALSNHL